MATYSKQILSGSIAGTPIQLTSASVMIHRTPTTPGIIDNISLWVTGWSQTSSLDVVITFGPVGGTAVTASNATIATSSRRTTELISDIPLTPSASTSMEVRAHLDTTGFASWSLAENNFSIIGYVNRIQ